MFGAYLMLQLKILFSIGGSIVAKVALKEIIMVGGLLINWHLK